MDKGQNLPVPQDLWAKTHAKNNKLQEQILSDFGEKLACIFPKASGKVEFSLVNGHCVGHNISTGSSGKRG